jgi:hypothetical protein
MKRVQLTVTAYVSDNNGDQQQTDGVKWSRLTADIRTLLERPAYSSIEATSDTS